MCIQLTAKIDDAGYLVQSYHLPLTSSKEYSTVFFDRHRRYLIFLWVTN